MPKPFFMASTNRAGIGIALTLGCLAAALVHCGDDPASPTASDAGSRVRDGASVADATLPDGEAPACTVATDCPTAAGACTDAPKCEANRCVYAPKVQGTPCGEGTDKCGAQTCDGAGTCVTAPVVCSNPPPTAVPANCTGTFKAKLGMSCATTCDPKVGCVYGEVDVPCPPAPGGGKLPQTEGWQVVLRNSLAAFKATDFDVPVGDIDYKDSYQLGADDLYRLWVSTHPDGSVGGLPHYRVLKYVPSASFTLATMEGSSGYQSGSEADADPLAMLFYRDWKYAGNPFAGSPGALKRAFALTSADMIRMSAALKTGNPDSIDNLSGATIPYGYVGAKIKDEASLDACTRAAYAVGLRQIFDWFEPKNTGNTNGDMIIAQVEGYAFMADALGDGPTRVRAAAKAKKQIDAICSHAGYCQHAGPRGYDAYYEGWTQNHLTAAALHSKWPDVRTFALELHDLRATTSLPQPMKVGNTEPCIGPSLASPATPYPACSFGGDFADSRDLATATLSPSAAYLALGGIPGTAAYPSTATMIADIKSGNGLSRAVDFASRGRCGNGAGFAACSVALDTWDTRHYPRGLAVGAMFLQPGTYAALGSTLAQTPDLAKLPVLRSADYVRALGGATPELIVAKLGGASPFAAVIQGTTVNGSMSGDGFGGGALGAFWTKAQGSALLAWNIGRNYTAGQADPGPWYHFGNWKKWPTHAISGRSGSNAFSSARLKNANGVYDTSKPLTASAQFSGDLSATPAAQATLSGKILYTRTIGVSAAGVTVKSGVAPSGTAPVVDELYETLPVFSMIQGEGVPTVVRFRVQGSANFADAVVGAPVVKVDRVRLERYGKAVEIVLATPVTAQIVNDDVALPASPPSIAAFAYRSQVLLFDLGQAGGPLMARNIEYTISSVP